MEVKNLEDKLERTEIMYHPIESKDIEGGSRTKVTQDDRSVAPSPPDSEPMPSFKLSDFFLKKEKN